MNQCEKNNCLNFGIVKSIGKSLPVSLCDKHARMWNHFIEKQKIDKECLENYYDLEIMQLKIKNKEGDYNEYKKILQQNQSLKTKIAKIFEKWINEDPHSSI